MNDVSVIDRFLNVFSTYIDSGSVCCTVKSRS